MIVVLVKIDFHAQLGQARPDTVASLASSFRGIAKDFGAFLAPTEDPTALGFETSPSHIFRAAEAAWRCLQAARSRSSELLGFAVMIDASSAGMDETLARYRKTRHLLDRGGSLFLTEAAAAIMGRYFSLRRSAPSADQVVFCAEVLDLAYRIPALAYGERNFEKRPAVARQVAEALERAFAAKSGFKCAALMGKPEWGAMAALEEALAPWLAPGITPPRVRPGHSRENPLAPVLRVLDEGLLESALARAGAATAAQAASPPDEGELRAGAAEEALLRASLPAYELAMASPFREAFPPSALASLSDLAIRCFRSYAEAAESAGGKAIVLCEDIDRLPPASADLVLSAAESLPGLILAAVSGTSLPQRWALLPGPRLGFPSPTLEEFSSRVETMGIEALATLKARKTAFSRCSASLRALHSAAIIASCGLTGEAFAERVAGPAAAEVEALRILPPEMDEILLGAALARDALGLPRTEAFLERLGYPRAAWLAAMRELSGMGFSLSPDSPDVRSADAAPAALALGEGAARIREAFSAFLYDLYQKRVLAPSTGLFSECEPMPDAIAARFYSECAATEEAQGTYRPVPAPGPSSAATGMPAARAFASFTDAFRRGESIPMDELEREATGQDPLGSGLSELALGFQGYAEGERERAASSAKRASMRLHMAKAHRFEARAQRLLGLCALAEDKLTDAQDYFQNAFELAESSGDVYEGLVALVRGGGAWFANGAFPKAQRLYALAEKAAKAAFRPDWETFARFAQGRAHFETADYTGALAEFDATRSMARVYGIAPALARSEAWMGRSLAAAGDAEAARGFLEPMADDPEAVYFIAENFALAEDYPEAAGTRGGDFTGAFPPERHCGDAPDWRSGYREMEGRVSLGPFAYEEDLGKALRLYASGMAGSDEGAASALEGMTREDRLSASNPCLHVYHFFAYRIAESGRGAGVDMATILSKAFKALQGRASKIDDDAMKQRFLEKGRWNRLLLDAARAAKLL